MLQLLQTFSYLCSVMLQVQVDDLRRSRHFTISYWFWSHGTTDTKGNIRSKISLFYSSLMFLCNFFYLIAFSLSFLYHRDLVLGCILLIGPSGLWLIMPALRILLFLYLYMTHLVSDQNIIVSLSLREGYSDVKCKVFLCAPFRSRSS